MLAPANDKVTVGPTLGLIGMNMNIIKGGRRKWFKAIVRTIRIIGSALILPVLFDPFFF